MSVLTAEGVASDRLCRLLSSTPPEGCGLRNGTVAKGLSRFGTIAQGLSSSLRAPVVFQRASQKRTVARSTHSRLDTAVTENPPRSRAMMLQRTALVVWEVHSSRCDQYARMIAERGDTAAFPIFLVGELLETTPKSQNAKIQKCQNT